MSELKLTSHDQMIFEQFLSCSKRESCERMEVSEISLDDPEAFGKKCKQNFTHYTYLDVGDGYGRDTPWWIHVYAKKSEVVRQYPR